MDYLVITQALGIAAIYLGFAFTLGYLIHRSMIGSHGWSKLIAIGFTTLIVLPATVMLVGFEPWAYPSRIIICASGWMVIVLTSIQPKWIPAWVWQQPFHRLYLSIAMALVTAWGLSAWLLYASSVAMVIGLAALTAGSSSVRSMVTA